ncbi:EF-hand domain pair family protein [Brugia pahangi]
MFFCFIIFYILQNIVAQNVNTVVRFDEIDKDSDKRITLNEMKSWHKMNHIIKSDKELKEMIQSKDRNNDGMLNIAEFVTLLLTRKSINYNEQIFKRIDKNGDGVITPAEAMQSKDNGINEKIIHEIFQLVDFNGDSKITIDEFTSAMNGNLNDQQYPNKQAGKNQNLAYQLMTLIDQNLDHKLSVQEVFNFARANTKKNKTEIIEAFGHLDSNYDGFLTINEIIAQTEKIVALVHFQEPPPVVNN